MTSPSSDGPWSGRFARHLQLPEVGTAGQARLDRAQALVVGAGGLGCAVLPYLVAAGLRAVTVCDGDVVELSNLPRQVLYGDDDVGRPKALAAVGRLQPLRRDCILTAIDTRLDESNAAALVSAADVVIDATDDFATRYLIHDTCFALRRPLVTAAVHHDEGQLAVFRFDRAAAGPCWRCLWPQPPSAAACDGGCAQQGILGPVPGVLGALEAVESLRILLGASPLPQGRLVHVDLTSLETWCTTWSPVPSCPLCGRAETPAAGHEAGVTGSASQQDDAEEVRWEELAEPDACLWIDARPEYEQVADPDPAALAGLTIRPWRMYGHEGPPAGRPVVVFCAHGIRSLALVRHWRAAGGAPARSLRGGLAAQRRRRT